MKTILKIIGGIAIVVFLFIFYPYYTQYAAQYFNIANIIYDLFGKTMTSQEMLYFSALPLIGLVLIIWIGYKAITSKWGR